MGPLTVSPQCRKAWLSSFEGLVEKGYLSGFTRQEAALSVDPAQVTPRGEPFLGRLVPGSFYYTLNIVSTLRETGLQILRVTRFKEAGAYTGALVVFRIQPAEPFLILWRNEIFEGSCGAEIHPDVRIEDNGIKGHAHISARRSGWRVEKVLLGMHAEDE